MGRVSDGRTGHGPPGHGEIDEMMAGKVGCGFCNRRMACDRRPFQNVNAIAMSIVGNSTAERESVSDHFVPTTKMLDCTIGSWCRMQRFDGAVRLRFSLCAPSWKTLTCGLGACTEI
jgi:hypothetical protein